MAEKKAKKSEAPERVVLNFNELLQKFEEERGKLASYDQRRHNVEKVILDASAALAALEGIEKAEKGEKILVPVGSGIYIEAMADDLKNVKTALTADYVMETSLVQAKKTLNERIESFSKTLQRLAGHEQRSLQNLRSMEQIIRRMQQRPHAAPQPARKA